LIQIARIYHFVFRGAMTHEEILKGELA